MSKTMIALLLVAGLLLTGGSGALAQEKQAFLWDGSQWPSLPYDAKVGFIKGMGNLADYEVAMGGTDRRACLSRALVNDLKNQTIDQVIQEVDKFYQANPDKTSMPVIEVVMRKCTKICPPETQGEKKK